MADKEATTTTVDLTADRAGLSRPERFVLAQADYLTRQPGREVEVTREVTVDQWGTTEWLRVWSPSPRWFENAVSVSAVAHDPVKSEWSDRKRPKRWKFVHASVIGKKTAKTYTAAESMVYAYGHTVGGEFE